MEALKGMSNKRDGFCRSYLTHKGTHGLPGQIVGMESGG